MNILELAILKKMVGGGGGSGTDNYNDLSNLPKINDTTLSGNKSSSALGLQSEITSENKIDSDLIDDTDQDNKFVTSTEKNTWNGKQNAIDADHKLNADYVDDSTSTNKFVTASDKETWNAKQNAIDNSHKLSSDLVDDTNHTNKFVTSSEKQTWNNKQNAIDSDHKLSSSLVSFTTAEAAALASGIDSSKVGQISTNQTNIWSVADNVPVNQFSYTLEDLQKWNAGNWNGNVFTTNNINFTVNDDMSITVSGTSTSGTAWMVLSIGIPLSGEYVLHGCPAGGSSGAYELQVTIASSDKKDYGSGVVISPNNNLKGAAIGIRVGTWNVTFKPVIVAKSLYDAGLTGWVQPAKQNYDLTRLEAEDRAGLIECVDGGAKNELQPSWTTQEINGVKFTVGSDGVITATTTGTRTSAAIYPLLSRYSGTKMTGKVMSISPKGGTNASYYVAAEQADSPWHNVGTDYGDGVVISSEANNKDINVNIVIPANYSPNNLKFSPMLCTKAAFGVSNKFVPYRPNYDLVVSEIGHHLVDDGNTNHSTATCNCSNWTAGVYLVAVNRYQNPTTAYGTALYLMTVNDNILPLFTTIVETADCKATFALSNDKVLSITYPHSAFWQAYAKRI